MMIWRNWLTLAQYQLRQHIITISLAVILLLAFWLRVRGYDFGLPNLYYPDEYFIKKDHAFFIRHQNEVFID